jgi:hypothetical protein
MDHSYYLCSPSFFPHIESLARILNRKNKIESKRSYIEIILHKKEYFLCQTEIN